VWFKQQPIPVNSGWIQAEFSVPNAYAKGEPIYWHVSNHGPNSWALVDISLGPLEIPEGTGTGTGGDDGACLAPEDETQFYNQDFFQQVSEECAGPPCKDPGAPDYLDCVTQCLKKYWSEPCAICVAQHVKCIGDKCAKLCMGGGEDACLTCLVQECNPPFEKCAGVEAPT
jgi:hypothetical protein